MENILIKTRENLKTGHEWQPKMQLTQNTPLLPERSEFWVSSRVQENHPLSQKQRQNAKQNRKWALVMRQSESNWEKIPGTKICCRGLRIVTVVNSLMNIYKPAEIL